MRISFRNFTGGEVTPSLSARYDLNKAGSFLSSCLNFIPNLHGDIERRPGTRFIADLGAPSVLIPFQFNTEPENNYVLIFQEGRIKVAHADRLLANVEIASPYALADVYELSTAQAADVIYLAHKNYALRKLTRSGIYPDYQWKLEPVNINRSLPPPDNLKVKFVRDNSDDKGTLNYTLRYVVTAVDDAGVESLASEIGECIGKYPTDWVVGNHATLEWESVNGAVEYNIYRETAGYYGLIGVCRTTDSSGGKITGLKVGAYTAKLCHYAASQSRTIINGNGFVPDEDSGDSQITLVKDNSAKAYLLEEDHKLFVKLGYSIVSHTYLPIEDEPKYEIFQDTKITAKWIMLDFPDSDQTSFTDYVPGVMAGDKDDDLRGSFGGYSVKSLYTGLTTLSFQDQNFEADTSQTPKEDWDPFADGNNPGVVAFHQQRLALASTKQNPASFFMSRSGDYENFRKSRPQMDDDPLEYMVASGSVDAILWLASFGDLIIGTSGAEYTATSSGAAISPSDIQISAQSYWGSSNLFPMVFGQSILHCQRAGSRVRDLFYSWESDGYSGNDLSLLAPQLVENARLKQWCFQQSPGSNIWIVRDDGLLLCLTYMKEQNVFGWSRHATSGKALSVASLCGDEEDQIMLVVERVINGHKHWFLERLAQRFKNNEKIENAFFLDCGKTVTQEADSVCAGFEHLEGMTVNALCDGTPVSDLLVVNGQIELPFRASQVSAGLNYISAFMPMPIETDTQEGSTLGKRRAYGKCVLRLLRSVGGAYGPSKPGDIFDNDSWKEGTFYDLPYLPEKWGEAAQPFSGDIEITLPSGQDADCSIWIIQDKPLPFRLASLSIDTDFGEH